MTAQLMDTPMTTLTRRTSPTPAGPVDPVAVMARFAERGTVAWDLLVTLGQLGREDLKAVLAFARERMEAA